MRGLRSFLVLLVLAVGLGAYIYFVESKRPSSADEETKRDKVFTVEADKIQQIEVRSEKGERTTLKKADGKWQIVQPVAAPADETEVSSLASGLASAEVQRVVEEKPADLAEYGLKAPRFEVEFQASGNTEARRLLVGLKTPTGGDLYAKVAGQDRVFLIPAYLESSFNRETFDLRDKRLLTIDRSKVDALEVDSAGKTLRFAKAGADWKITSPVQARADYSLVEGVIGRVDEARVNAIVATELTNLQSYGLDKPAVTIRLGMGSSQAVLEFGKMLDDKDRVYARDLSRPLVFAVQKSLSEDLSTKTAADYRRKDLFEYRPFTATHIEFARDGKTYTFEKTKAADGAEKWKQTAPIQREPDATKVDAALSAFANLRAQSFVDSTNGTGVDKPAVVVSVAFGDGDSKKKERVTFGRTADAAYAVPDGEPGAAKLEATDLANALKALDEVIK
jgi:hypothetical protein